MKKILLIIILTSISFSCAKQSDVDCLTERLEIIEKFDRLIELANGDLETIASLKKQKNDKLALLDC